MLLFSALLLLSISSAGINHPCCCLRPWRCLRHAIIIFAASSVCAVAVLLMIANMLLPASMRGCYCSADAGVRAHVGVPADAGVPTAVDFADRPVPSSAILSFLLSVSAPLSVGLFIDPSALLYVCLSVWLSSICCLRSDQLDQPSFLSEGVVRAQLVSKKSTFPRTLRWGVQNTHLWLYSVRGALTCKVTRQTFYYPRGINGGIFKHETDWTGLILALIFSHEYKHDVCSMSEQCVKRECLSSRELENKAKKEVQKDLF